MKITLSHEKPRTRFLVRIEAMPAKSFRYEGAGKIKAMKAEAETYIRAECRKHNFLLPAQFVGAAD